MTNGTLPHMEGARILRNLGLKDVDVKGTWEQLSDGELFLYFTFRR